MESPKAPPYQERGFSTVIVQGGVGLDIDFVWSGRKGRDEVSSGNHRLSKFERQSNRGVELETRNRSNRN